MAICACHLVKLPKTFMPARHLLAKIKLQKKVDAAAALFCISKDGPILHCGCPVSEPVVQCTPF